MYIPLRISRLDYLIILQSLFRSNTFSGTSLAASNYLNTFMGKIKTNKRSMAFILNFHLICNFEQYLSNEYFRGVFRTRTQLNICNGAFLRE